VFFGVTSKKKNKRQERPIKNRAKGNKAAHERVLFSYFDFGKKNLESGNLKLDQVTIGAVFHELILGSKEDEKSNSKNDLLKTETKK